MKSALAAMHRIARSLGRVWPARSRAHDAAAAADADDAALATAEPSSASTSTDGALAGLVHGVVPVWRRHMDTVRGQTEEATQQLVASFESIKQQFDDAGFNTSTDAEATTLDLLTLCERQLNPVVSSMHRIVEGKDLLMKCVNELASATQELQGMANDVRKIASHTNILAINAAIEAAHAGEAGRGFAVIANAIRELSQHSAQTGQRISQRMSQVEQVMVTTVQTAEEASRHDSEAIALSGNVIEDVLAHVRMLGEEAKGLRERGAVIRRDTDNLLVNLQFQDRVSQIIGAVDKDMQRFEQTVERGELDVPSVQAWLTQLSDCYTMDDQRRVAKGQSAVPGGAAPAATTEVEFF